MWDPGLRLHTELTAAKGCTAVPVHGPLRQHAEAFTAIGVQLDNANAVPVAFRTGGSPGTDRPAAEAENKCVQIDSDI